MSGHGAPALGVGGQQETQRMIRIERQIKTAGRDRGRLKEDDE